MYGSNAETIEETKAKYKCSVPCNGWIVDLTNRDDARKAFRLQCPALGMSFGADCYIGRDVTGTLYFNNLYNVDRPISYTITESRDFDARKELFHVVFNVDGKPDAEFIIEEGTHGMMDGYSGESSWNTQGVVQVPAVLSYEREQIKLRAELIGACCEIFEDRPLITDHFDSYTRGTLYYTDLKAIKDSVRLVLDGDRIEFLLAGDKLPLVCTAYFLPCITKIPYCNIPGTDWALTYYTPDVVWEQNAAT